MAHMWHLGSEEGQSSARSGPRLSSVAPAFLETVAWGPGRREFRPLGSGWRSARASRTALHMDPAVAAPPAPGLSGSVLHLGKNAQRARDLFITCSWQVISIVKLLKACKSSHLLGGRLGSALSGASIVVPSQGCDPALTSQSTDPRLWDGVVERRGRGRMCTRHNTNAVPPGRAESSSQSVRDEGSAGAGLPGGGAGTGPSEKRLAVRLCPSSSSEMRGVPWQRKLREAVRDRETAPCPQARGAS